MGTLARDVVGRRTHLVVSHGAEGWRSVEWPSADE